PMYYFLFVTHIKRQPISTLFPYTTLFRSRTKTNKVPPRETPSSASTSTVKVFTEPTSAFCSFTKARLRSNNARVLSSAWWRSSNEFQASSARSYSPASVAAIASINQAPSCSGSFINARLNWLYASWFEAPPCSSNASCASHQRASTLSSNLRAASAASFAIGVASDMWKNWLSSYQPWADGVLI